MHESASTCIDELEDITVRGEGLGEEGEWPREGEECEWEESPEVSCPNMEEEVGVAGTDEFYDRIVELSDSIQRRLVEGQDRERPDGDVAASMGDGFTSESNGKIESPMPPPTSTTPPPPQASPPSRCSSTKSQFDDPKVQRAYEKMLRLDERLAGLSRREREVKRKRQALEEEMERVGAGQVVTSGSGAGSRHQAISPVFHTQPYETGKYVVVVVDDNDDVIVYVDDLIVVLLYRIC